MAQIQNNTDKTKKSGTLKLFLFILIFLGTIATYVFSSRIFGENSIFNSAPTDNVTLNTLWQAIPKILKTVQIITLTIIIQKILRFIASKSLAKTKRGITISKLFDSFIKYLIAIIAILLVLGAWGVDTETLIASAGILGLVIGLGAQSLIADIIAGVFIVFEGAYEVGDIVVIDGWRGTVSEIGIRTTKLIDAGGNIKVINNSNVVTVINQTKELSLATCTIRIEYGENLERVEAIINENLANINKKIPTIVDGLCYKGVTALNTSSVDLLFIAGCKEEDIYQTQRDINRELKLLFDKNDINIPITQITISQPTPNKK